MVMTSGLIRIPAGSLGLYTITQANGFKIVPKPLTGTSDYYVQMRLRNDPDYAESWALLNDAGLTVYPITMIGHRGFNDDGPQNTLWNARHCGDFGAPLEGDVSFTSDGVRRMFHDGTVDALTNGTGTFTSLTDSYIQGLSFLSTAGTELANERIPTFAAWLAVAKARGVPVWPEIKAPRPASVPADIQTIIDDIVASGISPSQVYLQSFNLTELQTARAYHPTINLMMAADAAATVTANVAAVTALGNSGFIVEQTVIDASVVSTCAGMVAPLTAYTLSAYVSVFPLALLGVKNMLVDSASFL
jgi:glycerophosphoryl diester phosphodiesterase